MHLDTHPVVEQNASVIAQTNPGPACANDGTTLLSRQEAVSLRHDWRSILPERTLENRFDEEARRRRPGIVFRILKYVPRSYW
jgi:hypothetical protein